MSTSEEQYNELFDEFEAFKRTSQDMEEVLQNSLNAANDDIRRLRKQLEEAQKDKESYRDRLNNNTTVEGELRSEIVELKETIAEMRTERTQYRNNIEVLENTVRKDEFTINKLSSSNNTLEEELIINIEERDELRAQLLETEKEYKHAKEEIEKLLNDHRYMVHNTQYSNTTGHCIGGAMDTTSSTTTTGISNNSNSNTTVPHAQGSVAINHNYNSQQQSLSTVPLPLLGNTMDITTSTSNTPQLGIGTVRGIDSPKHSNKDSNSSSSDILYSIDGMLAGDSDIERVLDVLVMRLRKIAQKCRRTEVITH